MNYLLPSVLLLSAASACAQPPSVPRLVGDLNTAPYQGGSFPSLLTERSGHVYFTADDRTETALWRSDGTPAGTLRIGSAGRVQSMMASANRVFLTNDEKELWCTDDSGTGLVKVATLSSGANLLGGKSGRMFFSIQDRLHVSDGTAAGTISLGSTLKGYNSAIAPDGGIYFFVRDDAFLCELWKSDGSAAGTRRVRAIYPGDSPQWLVMQGNTLWFSATSPAGAELWKSDGTEAGTVTFGTGRPVGAVGSSVYLLRGHELWKSNGTAAGTSLVKALMPNPLPSGSNAVYGQFTAAGGRLFFASTEWSSVSGGEVVKLWVSDGTSPGTLVLKEGPSWQLTAVGSEVYFVQNTGTGNILFRTDGTVAGTVTVANLRQVTGLKAVGNRLYFSGDDGTHGNELWAADAAGSFMVKDIAGGTQDLASNYASALDASGVLYFAGGTTTGGTELWRSDGTAGGTSQLRDIAQGNGSSFPTILQHSNGLTWLEASATANNPQLWVTDGTPAGTRQRGDFRYSDQPSAAAAGTRLWVKWQSNNSLLWTTTVAERTEVPSPGGVSNLTPFAGAAWYTGQGPAGGWALWKGKADGSREAVFLSQQGIVNLFVHGDSLYFNSGGLWQCDGTSAGTKKLDSESAFLPKAIVEDTAYYNIGDRLMKRSLRGGPAQTVVQLPSIPDLFYSVNGLLLFWSGGLETGRELWRCDGTAPGTLIVKDIHPGPAWSAAGLPVVVGNRLWFPADDGEHGAELWTSDGSAAGTRLAADIAPGSGSSLPSSLTPGTDRLWLTATTNAAGRELYVLDAVPPSVELLPPSDITGSTATLNGRVNPNGVAGTVAQFEYGPAGGMRSPAASGISLASATSFLEVITTVSGLTPGTLYEYRLVAANADDSRFTQTSTFATPISAAEWRAQWFGSPADSGAAALSADPDGDGRLNLAEFAIGSNPTVAEASFPALPAVEGGEFVFRYSSRPGVAGVVFSAEWSTDASLWTPLTDTGSGAEHVFRIQRADRNRVFFRARFTVP